MRKTEPTTFRKSARDAADSGEPETAVGGSVGWDDGSAVAAGAAARCSASSGPNEVEHDILSDLSEPEPRARDGHGRGRGLAEGLGGPSWQEPGALEVDRRGPTPDERDVPAAFLTGGILAIAALAALLIGDWLFGLLAGAPSCCWPRASCSASW